ncbi:hypothetical protein IVG45_07310 [Methylomonas sp. LL1]|uniref:hypothetical protein n=1 Tax=Methylomonas sp. LL1 TaxID=2785785 RepID=UPI0018C3A383|nr:hypothetical protein [Methylomonas sp. LL1]QPK64747.1 hypothetical protein IVG45_07310 [Methylomonas sp. LL1]
MQHYSKDCSVCKMMRSLAFSALGMGLGAGVAYLLGATRQNMVYSGIVVASILIFGFLGRDKDKK